MDRLLNSKWKEQHCDSQSFPSYVNKGVSLISSIFIACTPFYPFFGIRLDAGGRAIIRHNPKRNEERGFMIGEEKV
jgi:hypothetical protein